LIDVVLQKRAVYRVAQKMNFYSLCLIYCCVLSVRTLKSNYVWQIYQEESDVIFLLHSDYLGFCAILHFCD